MVINSFSGQYYYLSNFYPFQIEYNGVEYPTVENAFQAQKNTTLVDKLSSFPKSGKVLSPGQAKLEGRRCKLRLDWNIVKDQIMEELILVKFSYPALKPLLLATDNNLLIEGNTWHDNYWGDCQCNNRDRAHIRCVAQGKNKLGQILMSVRNKLREEKIE